MELTSPAHPIDANATYRLPDGSLTYTIEASGFFTKKTQIWKLSGNIRAVIGQLTCPGDTSKSPDEVIVNGIRIMLEKSSDEGLASNKLTFHLNNQSYLWEASLKTAHLTDNFEHRIIATYKKGSKSIFRKSRLSSLEIVEEAIPLVDEIFSTFVLTQQISARDLVNKGQPSILQGNTGGAIGPGSMF